MAASRLALALVALLCLASSLVHAHKPWHGGAPPRLDFDEVAAVAVFDGTLTLARREHFRLHTLNGNKGRRDAPSPHLAVVGASIRPVAVVSDAAAVSNVAVEVPAPDVMPAQQPLAGALLDVSISKDMFLVNGASDILEMPVRFFKSIDADGSFADIETLPAFIEARVHGRPQADGEPSVKFVHLIVRTPAGGPEFSSRVAYRVNEDGTVQVIVNPEMWSHHARPPTPNGDVADGDEGFFHVGDPNPDIANGDNGFFNVVDPSLNDDDFNINGDEDDLTWEQIKDTWRQWKCLAHETYRQWKAVAKNWFYDQPFIVRLAISFCFGIFLGVVCVTFLRLLVCCARGCKKSAKPSQLDANLVLYSAQYTAVPQDEKQEKKPAAAAAAPNTANMV